MEIQVLHIDDCPNWEETGRRVRQALESIELGHFHVGFMLIRTADDAMRTGLAGSPTILVDGRDLFPSEGRTADFACGSISPRTVSLARRRLRNWSAP